MKMISTTNKIIRTVWSRFSIYIGIIAIATQLEYYIIIQLDFELVAVRDDGEGVRLIWKYTKVCFCN